ncbi:MAG: GatB/YqeY domain-containing protein [Xanthomonadales bacterium]|nr:GatB/YqeY domain-containing protein [Xanthomonadales bacterium]MCC6560877.1 GatB/YqeY domain-containing protein [Xanthomonadales bacterium]
MSLKLKLTEDMKAAMKSGAKDRLQVIRLINAGIKQREVDERIQLDDTQVLSVLEKMVKQRKDSITQYEAAAREDLAQVERYELGVIQTYLPAQMAAEEVEAIVVAAIAEAGAASAKDMGKVIALVKPKVAGRTDMGKLSELVKQKLAALG